MYTNVRKYIMYGIRIYNDSQSVGNSLDFSLTVDRFLDS